MYISGVCKCRNTLSTYFDVWNVPLLNSIPTLDKILLNKNIVEKDELATKKSFFYKTPIHIGLV